MSLYPHEHMALTERRCGDFFVSTDSHSIRAEYGYWLRPVHGGRTRRVYISQSGSFWTFPGAIPTDDEIAAVEAYRQMQ